MGPSRPRRPRCHLDRVPLHRLRHRLLAFGHIVIALFFVLPFRDPVRYAGVIQVGMVASVTVIPTAIICGQIRGIPSFWRLIDCCFGVVCFAVLWWTLAQIRKLPQPKN